MNEAIYFSINNCFRRLNIFLSPLLHGGVSMFSHAFCQNNKDLPLFDRYIKIGNSVVRVAQSCFV